MEVVHIACLSLCVRDFRAQVLVGRGADANSSGLRGRDLMGQQLAEWPFVNPLRCTFAPRSCSFS